MKKTNTYAPSFSNDGNSSEDDDEDEDDDNHSYNSDSPNSHFLNFTFHTP